MDGAVDHALELLVDSLTEEQGLHVVDIDQDLFEELSGREDLVDRGTHFR